MMTRARHIITRFIRADRGIAAVEFALLAPIFLMFMTLLLDLGIAYNAKLKIVSATAAAAQFAYVNGQKLTSTSVPAFLTQVASVATTTASLTTPPTVTVKFNNATDGSNAGNFYCVSGSYPTSLAWTSTGTSSASCGSNLMSGKFVMISLTASTTTVFYPNSVAAQVINMNDAAIVRLQ